MFGENMGLVISNLHILISGSLQTFLFPASMGSETINKPEALEEDLERLRKIRKDD